VPESIKAIEGVDAVVFGSPVCRATYSPLLKGVLKGTERHPRAPT
jgi:NAD(P)H-dependent FMN reductase